MKPHNAMQVKPPESLTVETLRAYLDEMESLWTEMDNNILGEFTQQRINVPYFEFDPGTGCNRFRGYGQGSIHYDGGLDFIIQECETEWKP